MLVRSSKRPRIRSNTVDLEYLRKLPPNTFGRNYSDFLVNYHYSPDERMMVNFVDDVDLAYVMLRYREIHDLVHVLLNQPTNMLGEVVVKWVEGLQCSLPLGLFGGYFGALRLAPVQTKNYLSTQLEFALRVGLHARNFMCVFFERYWEMDIHELRARLNVPNPPELKYKPRKKKIVS
ncbi:Ubiquinone biosynthesis protein [Sparganum proliferum]